jgi:hypothetical protein
MVVMFNVIIKGRCMKRLAWATILTSTIISGALFGKDLASELIPLVPDQDGSGGMVMLTADQAAKIRKTLEKIVRVYARDGSFDIVSEGAHASIDNNAQLAVVVELLQAIKSDIACNQQEVVALLNQLLADK